MVMVFTLTANIEGNGVADTVPLEVVGDAGVDAGLLPLHPLQHEALVRHDQTSAHICYQGAPLCIGISLRRACEYSENFEEEKIIWK